MTKLDDDAPYATEADYQSDFVGNLRANEPLEFYTFVSAATDYFKLKSKARIDFVARCVKKCLGLGAVPCVRGKPNSDEEWIEDRRYGTTPTSIYRNVMAEWIDEGAPDVEPLEGPAFGLPSQVVPRDKAMRRQTD